MGRLPISEDIHLRLLEESDAPELQRVVEANRGYLARWVPWAAAQTLEEAEAFIRRTREQVLRNDGFQLAIVSDGDIEGVVGFDAVNWGNRSTMIGYWLAESAQRRGTMTAAVRKLIEHAFTVWELNRVEIQAAVGNERSRAIPERLGFQQEGTLRQAERVGDRFLDLVVYSMLAADWGG
jgi:ribosomal-protein-serine acetyltransferase